MAKRGVNKVILVGNLGQDPEIRYTADGKAVANLSIATSEEWTDNQGQKQEKTEWHRVVVFGKLAEIVGEYLRKGSQVYFEGKLQTRKWQDQSGQDKYTTEVVVDGFDGYMQMLGGKSEQNNQNKNNQAQQGQYQQQAPQQQSQGGFNGQQQQQSTQQNQYQQAQQGGSNQQQYNQQQQGGFIQNQQQGGFAPQQ